MLPGFLIVGAQRCGTTSMYRTLSQHPAVLKAVLHKGVHYFDTGYDHGLAWYQGHFPLRARAAAARRVTGDEPADVRVQPVLPVPPAGRGADRRRPPRRQAARRWSATRSSGPTPRTPTRSPAASRPSRSSVPWTWRRNGWPGRPRRSPPSPAITATATSTTATGPAAATPSSWKGWRHWSAVTGCTWWTAGRSSTIPNGSTMTSCVPGPAEPRVPRLRAAQRPPALAHARVAAGRAQRLFPAATTRSWPTGSGGRRPGGDQQPHRERQVLPQVPAEQPPRLAGQPPGPLQPGLPAPIPAPGAAPRPRTGWPPRSPRTTSPAGPGPAPR